ncbi:hypothetical protein [uncultured Microbulbifer sp.]|uniref:hypothetical protein n=1 Tax=uncultured Microbulbifer sp. TaxID=348147 RepID=UPI0026165B35|nr:hypothetical protein [uncultured Microbulbifer sp.]
MKPLTFRSKKRLSYFKHYAPQNNAELFNYKYQEIWREVPATKKAAGAQNTIIIFLDSEGLI